MTQIAFLMRHATPDWTRTDIRYDVPPGPPLTEIGKAEARAAAQFLDEQRPTHIFASPLERTRDTAHIIAAELTLSVKIVDHLAEWREDEGEEDVAQRSLAYWESLWNGSADQPLRPLLVTHGGPGRLLLQGLGLPTAKMEHFRAQFDHNNPMPPAGIWRIERSTPQADWEMQMVFAPIPHKPYPQG